MGRIGINKEELRRVEALVRVKSKELKVVDAASLLRPPSQVRRNGIVGTWKNVLMRAKALPIRSCENYRLRITVLLIPP
jgi:hypothetical protein